MCKQLIDKKTFTGAKKYYVENFTNNVERLRIISKCENQ